MKVCYIDENGMGEEPLLVMAAVIVDAQRMHHTKAKWADFLNYLSRALGQTVTEFHTRKFYRGKDAWNKIDGSKRAKTTLRGRCPAAEQFWNVAPACLRN